MRYQLNRRARRHLREHADGRDDSGRARHAVHHGPARRVPCGARLDRRAPLVQPRASSAPVSLSTPSVPQPQHTGPRPTPRRLERRNGPEHTLVVEGARPCARLGHSRGRFLSLRPIRISVHC